MDEFEFMGKRRSEIGAPVPQFLSIYKHGDIKVSIYEPDPSVDDDEVREYWAKKPCEIFIGDGKMASRGGWTATIDVHKKDSGRSYILTDAIVGPISLLDTPLDRRIVDIDETEDNKYGAFKRAFLWAEKWLEEHYPGYTILPDEMREQG